MKKKLLEILKQKLSKQSRILRKISKKPRHKDFIVDINGYLIYAIDPPSFIAQYKDFMQRNVYKFNTISRKPFIIDCGTNIGLSILSYKKMYPNAIVVGFEPDPKIYKTAIKNIENENLSNVTIHNKAVWSSETTLRFLQEGAAGGRLVNTNDKNTINVTTFDLKKILDREVDFLKIDIEGAEYTILQDIDSQLLNVKNIFLEYHSKCNEEQYLGEMLSILKKNGFRYFLESGFQSPKQPLVSKNIIDNFDNLINIYGYRE